MMEDNKELFDEFRAVHAKYQADQETNQAEFNRVGETVVEKIREVEVELCAKSDSGQYSKYSSNLADKFWEAVRGYFPMIDFVGVK